MTVLVIIFLLLALIMLIPLGVCASYDSGGLMLKVRVSAYKKQIFPRESEPEPEPEPDTESAEDAGEKDKQRGSEKEADHGKERDYP